MSEWFETRDLRGVDPVAGQVEVHTDLYSDKIASLRANPLAALHVWLPDDGLQIRLQTRVAIAQGDAVRDVWAKVPDPSRQSYGITPAPGTPIKNALDYVKDPDPATFAVLTCAVMTIDVVHLGAVHRRAAFTREGEWQGQWLAP